MDAREIQYFQANLKKTALGIKFGKKLLTDPKSLTVSQITNVMKALGLPISKEVQIAQDVAQAIVTGAAVVDLYQQAETASDVNALISPSAGTAKSVGMIAEKNGWIDHKTGTQIRVGSDIAMIVASGGADVTAWIDLAVTIGLGSIEAEMQAKMDAGMDASAKVRGRVNREQQSFLTSIQRLQKGELGIFSFLADNVDNAPLMFDNLITNNPAMAPIVDRFPNLKFLPHGTWTAYGRGASVTWWGEAKWESQNIDLSILQKLPRENAFDYLIRNLIAPSADYYLNARNYFLSLGKADIFNVAKFALFNPEFFLSKQYNPLDDFIKYRITPYEIGEIGILQGIEMRDVQAIRSNFGLTVKADTFTNKEIEYFDRTGNLKPLVKNQFTRKRLQSVFSFPEMANEAKMLSPFNFRDMANFISVLDSLDLIYSDPQYSRIKNESLLIGHYDVLPKIQDFKDGFQKAFELSLVRRINAAAMGNVAYFLNKPVSKIEKNLNPSGPTIFK